MKDNNLDTKYPQKDRKNSDAKDKESSENEKELEDVLFPIDNSENNFLIIESNLSKEENLNNIIFMEFDLRNSNISKEKLKQFIEINNEFVEKEMFFVLNVRNID